MIHEVEQAISQAKTIEMYLSGAFVDEYAIGDTINANTHTSECALVYSNRRILEYWETFGDDLGLTDDQLWSVINTINEYEDRLLLNVTDYTSQVGDSTLGSITAPTVYGTLTPTPKSATLTAISDGQTTFALAFDIADVFDVDSISLVFGFLDPVYGTDYSITGTTLTWLSSVQINTGDELTITWWS